MIHYLPIDLPKLESSEKFSLEGFRESKGSDPGFHLSLFGMQEKEWNSLALKNWGFVKEYIEKYLPIKKLYFIRISKQLEHMGKYYDINGISDPKSESYNKELTENYNNAISPYSYRLVLEENSNILELNLEPWIELPSDSNSTESESKLPVFTNCYCINSFKTKHSVKMDGNRWVVFIEG